MKTLTRIALSAAALIMAISPASAESRSGETGAVKTQKLWPSGKMPDAQAQQTPKDPCLEWFATPEHPNGTCIILISGGSYQKLSDDKLIDLWHREFSARGVQCVNLVYRTPRSEGIPYYQGAWDDAQRAVRLVRGQAVGRGYDPEKIGVIAMSAGSHLGLLMAANSQSRAYCPVDRKDSVSAHINFAILNAPAYLTTDGVGGKATREGYGPDVKLVPEFIFDSKTCPVSLHHGGQDPYSPNGSTLVYRELRKRGIPAELHLYPGRKHGAYGLERGMEFLTQMGFLGTLEPEVKLMDRFTSDSARAGYFKEPVWPEGRMPDAQPGDEAPYIEWHIPAVRTTDAIQIIYSGGGYNRNSPESFEVTPARRYLNAKGMTVVTLKYRNRPSKDSGLAKHTTAWQDLQRAIRIVRSEAASRGLDPDRIGIMGSSAGGHLTLMGVTSSLHRSYLPIDDIDKLSCKVQWGIAIYPAYALTDGIDWHNRTRGNDDSAILVPDFSFDVNTAPTLFIHGDADKWAAMNSVKCWEKMRAMGVQSELHTLALRPHCFQKTASPGTGSYTWLDRIGEYLGL